MSYIYAIAASAAGPCKIGHSINPKSRFTAIQTGFPSALECMNYWELEHISAREAEAFVHNALSARRLHGEWFDISIKEAKEVISTVPDKPIEYRVRHNALKGTDIITAEDVFGQDHLDLISAALNHKRAVKAAQMRRYRAARKKRKRSSP